MEAKIDELLATLEAAPAGEDRLLAAARLDDQAATVGALPRAKHGRFATSLHACVEALPAAGADGARRAAAALVLARLRDKKAPTPPPLLAAARALHDALPRVGAAPARNAIVRVCEAFWSDCRAGRGALVPCAAVALLQRALAVEAGGASSAEDVRRIHALRDALCPLPESPSSPAAPSTASDAVDVAAHPHLRALLLRSATSALFQRLPEGQKFIARLLASPSLSSDVHAALLRMLPNVRKSRALACGTIHVHSWKAAGSDFFAPILQDVLSKAILAARDPLACNLRTVLSAFHTNKKLVGMDKMIHVVYTPVLFRALTAANPLVRRNAAIILADSFPIHDPDSSNVELESLLEDQCGKLLMLLQDPVPMVRVAAVEGACRVLGLLWELVPPATSRKMIHIITSTLAFDKTSAQVRAAVCDGMRFMLDNHQTHAVLSVALKRLRNVLNDRVERVRIAFLSLLVELKRKRIVSARYFDVADLDQLVLRLAVDSPGCVSRIMQLLVSSFFPLERKNKSRSEIASSQVRACSELLSKSPLAAQVFYSNVSMYIPPGALVEFCLRVATMATSIKPIDGVENIEPEEGMGSNPSAPATLRNHVVKDPSKRRCRGRSNTVYTDQPVPSSSDREPSSTGHFSALDAETKKGRLFGVVAIVLESIVPSLAKPSNADLLACVVNIFGGSSLRETLHEGTNSLETRLACLQISGTIPREKVLPVEKYWKAEFVSLIDQFCETPPSNSHVRWVGGLLRCGMCWGEADFIANTIESWTEVALSGKRSTVTTSKTSKRPRRRSRGDGQNESHEPTLSAVRCLSAVATALVENSEVASLHSNALKEEWEDGADDDENSEKHKPWSSVPSTVKRGVIGVLDMAIETGDSVLSDAEYDKDLAGYLAASLKLSLASHESTVNMDKNRRRDSHNDVLDVVMWVCNANTLISLYSRSDEFGWAVVNIISVLFADSVALGVVPPSLGGVRMNQMCRDVREMMDRSSKTYASEEGSQELLRFAMSALTTCYHILTTFQGRLLLADATHLRHTHNALVVCTLEAADVNCVLELFAGGVSLLSLTNVCFESLKRNERLGIVSRFAELLVQLLAPGDVFDEPQLRDGVIGALSDVLADPSGNDGERAKATCSTVIDMILAEVLIILAKRSFAGRGPGAFRSVADPLCARLGASSPIAFGRFVQCLGQCLLDGYGDALVLPQGVNDLFCLATEMISRAVTATPESNSGIPLTDLEDLRQSLLSLRAENHSIGESAAETEHSAEGNVAETDIPHQEKTP